MPNSAVYNILVLMEKTLTLALEFIEAFDIDEVLNAFNGGQKNVFICKAKDGVVYAYKLFHGYGEREEREIGFYQKYDDHPGIPRVIKVEEFKGSMVLVEEYIEGKSLSEVLQDGSFTGDADKVLGLTSQIIDILKKPWEDGLENREIHFVKESFVVNNQTRAHENLVWDMKVAIAHFYINNLSEEVRKGQAEKIRQGWLPTKPQLGYKTIGDKGHKIHVVDKNVAPLIKKLFELCATGNYSLAALVEKMYKMGLRSRNGGKVVKSRLHDMLTDPMYYGDFRWKGKVHKGKHEPIVEKDLWDRANTAISRGCSPYKTKTETELRGKIFCGSCGKTITWERQKGHSYGGCKQCKAQIAKDKKYIRQEDLEQDLLTHMVSVAPKSEGVLRVLEQALKESHVEESELHDTQVTSINNQLTRINQRLRDMYIDKLDNRITGETYDEMVNQFDEEKDDLISTLKKLESDNTQYYRVGIKIHELALLARKIYLSEEATVEERRMLLAYAFSNVTILQGEIKVGYTKPFNFLAEWMPKVNKVLELEKNVANKRQKSTFVPSCPILLRR